MEAAALVKGEAEDAARAVQRKTAADVDAKIKKINTDKYIINW